MTAPSRGFDIGDRVSDRYRIVGRLGQGAFGTTYSAEPVSGGERVAIKELDVGSLRDWKALELFEREAKVLSDLDHPGIPRTIEAFHTDADGSVRFFLVQTLAPGHSLAELVAQGFRPDETEIVRIARQVLTILLYLHGRSPPVVHRDVKPENIVRDDEGHVCLVDFGAVQSGLAESIATSGTVAGTFGYMAPEQIRGRAVAASDLFALGSTLVFLIAARSPADLPHPQNKLDLRGLPISTPFARWLGKMTAPALEDRFQTAAEALTALADARAAQGSRPRPLQMVIMALGVAALGGLFVLFVDGRSSDRELDPDVRSTDASPPPDRGRGSGPFDRLPTGAVSPIAWWSFAQSCSPTGVPSLKGHGLEARAIKQVRCERDGKALVAAFDGQGGYFEANDTPALHLTRSLSLAAHVKPTRVTGLGTIVNKWYAPDSYMLLVSDGTYRFTVATQGGQWGTVHEVASRAEQGAWARVVGVFDGAAIRLYVDGKSVGSKPVQGPLQDSSRPIAIGAHPTWNAFAGEMRDIRIYDVALSDEQVAALEQD